MKTTNKRQATTRWIIKIKTREFEIKTQWKRWSKGGSRSLMGEPGHGVSTSAASAASDAIRCVVELPFLAVFFHFLSLSCTPIYLTPIAQFTAFWSNGNGRPDGKPQSISVFFFPSSFDLWFILLIVNGQLISFRDFHSIFLRLLMINYRFYQLFIDYLRGLMIDWDFNSILGVLND